MEVELDQLLVSCFVYDCLYLYGSVTEYSSTPGVPADWPNVSCKPNLV